MKLWASSISEEEEQPSSSSISLLQQRQQQPSTPATTSSRHHNVFFGLPIVGFFRSVHSTEDERTPIITRSSRLSSERQHFDIEHQQRPVIHQRQQQYQQQSSATTKLQGKRRHRTGKELWAILRYHVYHETFHIDDWRTDEEKKTVVKNFDEMVLPYDFSVRDCLLALVV